MAGKPPLPLPWRVRSGQAPAVLGKRHPIHPARNPCLYCGDEAGLSGLKDPSTRTTYPWGWRTPAYSPTTGGWGNCAATLPWQIMAPFVPLFASREAAPICARLGNTG